jgi:hypothetical protein
MVSVLCELRRSFIHLLFIFAREEAGVLSPSLFLFLYNKKSRWARLCFSFFCLVHRAAGGRVIRSCDMSFCISPCFRVGTKRVEVPNERLGAGGGREHVFCWHGRVDPASSLPPARGRCSGCPARAAPSLVGHRRRDGIGNPRARDP